MQVRLASGLPRRFAIRRGLVIRTCSFTSATVSPPSPLQSCAGRQNRSERLPEPPALPGCCVSQDVLIPGPFVRNRVEFTGRAPTPRRPAHSIVALPSPGPHKPNPSTRNAAYSSSAPAPGASTSPPSAPTGGPHRPSHHLAAAPTNPTPRARRARTQCTPRTISAAAGSASRNYSPRGRAISSPCVCACACRNAIRRHRRAPRASRTSSPSAPSSLCLVFAPRR